MLSAVRAAVLVLVGVGSALVLAACGTSGGDGPDAAGGGRQPWGPFDEGVVVVEGLDDIIELCVLVADNAGERTEGLMDAPDAELGGYDGMAFSWDEDVAGGFWMKDTEVPLSIAYVDASGGVVSTADMDPCPSATERCPTYPSGGPYRLAVEVPQGGLAEVGIGPDDSVRLEDRACPGP